MGEAAVLGSTLGKAKRGCGFGGFQAARQVGRGITASPVGPPALGFAGASTHPDPLLMPPFLQPARGCRGAWGTPRAALTPPWAPRVGCGRPQRPRARGDTALSPQDPNWYKAKNKVGREGIIPANYVQKREGVKAGIKLSLMP